MKKLLFTFLATGCSLFSSSQCHRNVSVSTSLLVGVDKHGFSEGLEFGVWGVDQPLGIYAGFIAYNQPITIIERGKQVVINQPGTDWHVRITGKVYEDEHFYHILTAYAATSGSIGATYRLYRPLGDHAVAGVEIGLATHRNGIANAIFTFNF